MGNDDEAAEIWLNEIGVDAARLTRIGDKPGKKYESDNFWSMGDTGPCGPCTEIFYDHGADVAGGPPGTPEEDGDRYIEIWNLVFMQYDRAADGTMKPLPKPSVDTGMGLERLAAVLQGVHSNYEIDLFVNLINAAAKITGCDDLENKSLRVIADHIRSCSFLIVDGVLPSNEGRGYVLRRIIRRAVRHGHKLGKSEPFFNQLVNALASEMGDAYPELKKQKAMVEKVLRQEEERFAETLDQGMSILEDAISQLKDKVIDGETIFKLYDTYGFPFDLTADIARERNLKVDTDGFDKAMAEQRERARSVKGFAADYHQSIELENETIFTGYEQLSDKANVLALLKDGQTTQQLQAGEQGVVVLDKTPFYAESGGQSGDFGLLATNDVNFLVADTQKQPGGIFLHIGALTSGALKVGDAVSADVDESKRQATAYNHSATHLLHAALRQVLGDHVAQKGSLVDPERLRFDFSHFEPISREQINTIEAIVNEQIRANHVVETNVMDYQAAVDSGAMALFGEKYTDKVRVLRMAAFSVELCGGTHVSRTGDIGVFKITAETGIASGVRRIEAVSGQNAVEWMEQTESELQHVASLLKTSQEQVSNKVGQLLDRQRQLEKELEQLKGKLASSQGSDLAGQAVDVKGTKVLAAHLEGADPKSLRDTLDQLKNKLGTAAIVLATVKDDKVSLAAGVTADRIDKVKAGELVNMVAQQVGGKGGGRPDMAQAGGNDPTALATALASVNDWVQERL